MKSATALAAVATIALSTIAGPADAGRKRGIVGKPAPAWNLATWFNLPAGTSAVDLSDYRGKVVYLYFFQSWCPGCHKYGFPSLKRVQKHYAGDDNVAFVAVQTVFEGFSVNTDGAAKTTADEFDLDIPIAHDDGDGKRSFLMRKYRSGGTPWIVIIDNRGVVRFNAFHSKPTQSIALIDRLLAAPNK